MLPHQIPIFLSGGNDLLFHAPLLSSTATVKGLGSPTFTRATSATVWGYDSSDNYVLLTVGSGEPRFGGARYLGSGVWSSVLSTGAAIADSTLLGYYSEGQRTNYVLWNRDLTNAAWTAANCTVAKDQTGIDGNANSASSLTATAGNATCLQSLTRSSTTRITGCWIKRITGTGTINMTQDNGGTWTAVTVTGSWTRVSIPSATLANPTVGFRIVTSGDVVAVDYVQHEEAAFLSSDIATTTASVTRNADSLIYPSTGNLDRNQGSMYVEQTLPVAITTNASALFADNNSATERLGLRQSGGNIGGIILSNNVTQAAFAAGTTVVANTRYKTAMRWRTNDVALIDSGAVKGTDTAADMPLALTQIAVGYRTSVATDALYGYARNAKIWKRPLSDGALKAMTT
jgi:hypothetical protein